MDYQFTPLQKVSSNGSSATIGHAMIWRPSKKLMVTLLVSQAAIERDFNEIPFSNMKKYQKPGIRPAPHPGHSIREAVEKFPGGLVQLGGNPSVVFWQDASPNCLTISRLNQDFQLLKDLHREIVAYFNAGEMGILNCPIIMDGQLITKPKPIKALFQKEWEPINGIYTFFMQYPTGKVQIEDLPIRNNQFTASFPKGTYGFSAPYIIKEGKHTPLKTPPSGQAPNSQEVLFPGGKTQAPISAIGIDKQGRVIRISLVGDVDKPNEPEHFPTEYDLIDHLQQFNVVTALYTGASADVQYYDSNTQTLGIGPERPKSADRKWLLREGQTERGIAVIGVLGNSRKIMIPTQD